MKLKDLHEDMERYLQNDCYCPGEIYDVSGFFCMTYSPGDICELIAQSDNKTACVVNLDSKKPQAIMFWHDDKDNPRKIVFAQRMDATKNNVEILRDIVREVPVDGKKINEFNPGELAESLANVLGMCDAVIVD